MNHLGVAAACLTLLLPLAGCGSSSPPPFSVACTVHRLPSGSLQARVTVTNSTSVTGTAFIYGPAFRWLRYIHPVLTPAQVVVQVPHSAPNSYFGYAIPGIRPDKPSHLILRFRNPPSVKPVAVTMTQTVNADSSSVVDNPDCRIPA